jgi:hypothetical protein
MLDQVPVTTRPLDAYRPLVGDAEIERIRTLAAPFAGARVLHLNATASGGGVAELLATLVPLMRAVGLDAEWRTLRCADGFFAVTKAMHNALQGADLPLTGEMRAVWERHTRENARDLEGSYDLIIVHDPQPAGIRAMLDRQSSGAWVWRCHIDLTTSDPAAWDFLRPYLTGYDAAVFSMPEYAKRDLTGPRIAVIPPSIDPLSPKNAALPHERVRAIVRDYGIDPDRPLLVQVSRFDPWKDPLGVIAAYRTVKRAIPDVQLALLGALATDDPGGAGVARRGGPHRRGGCGHRDPVQPGRDQRRGGERLPAGGVGVHPEVAAGRVRPDGGRGAAQGATGRCGRCGRYPRADRGRGVGVPGTLGGGVRAALPADPARPGAGRAVGTGGSCAGARAVPEHGGAAPAPGAPARGRDTSGCGREARPLRRPVHRGLTEHLAAFACPMRRYAEEI